ncbi:conserved hypothetical protein [Rippkaea orientalis PCC 8801]|uniref:DUF2808 domain-containing protein n=1 Tax=Rippkaea orientalis (strain PCC 8801 / RF-1) TaxID=41431 RepID=B7JYX2_RIPO1|nr:DUF2808 domain-containing protein [Rippkaea orientalis]ACK66049.1 conserved hypothetical protein [Rippkaea orientalis PCC 8801]
MKIRSFLLLTLLTLSITLLSLTPRVLTQDLPFPANATFFTGQPPTLVSAGTPDNAINWQLAHYYFTFNVPNSSPQSVGKVSIEQETNVETIQFNLSNTTAFQGTQDNPGQSLTVKVTENTQDQAIAITFDPPVPPNSTFTIRLEANQNPSTQGTYIFRVKAFPNGDNPIGLDLGVGRISFYQNF